MPGFGTWLTLALALLPVAAGGGGRRLLSRYGQQPTLSTDPDKNDLNQMQKMAADAKIAASKIKVVYAANTAMAAAAQARTAEYQIANTYVHTMAIPPELAAIKKVAEAHAAKAEEAVKTASGAYKDLEAIVKTSVVDSQKLAVAGVQQLFRDKYHELASWREHVLTNPWERAQVAATKAAVPYFKMMGSFGASMAGYGLEASTMRSQAASDAANAKALADGVEEKKKTDPIGAAQDDEMAKALKLQSEQLNGRAATLEGQVASMQNAVPEYASAAHMAAWNAEYATNPDGLPPPPLNPNFAYTPPPPTA